MLLNLMPINKSGPSYSNKEMFPSPEMIILSIKLMRSHSSFSED